MCLDFTPQRVSMLVVQLTFVIFLFILMLFLMNSLLDSPSYGGVQEPEHYSIFDFVSIVWITIVDENDPYLLHNVSSPLLKTLQLLENHDFRIFSWVLICKDVELGKKIWYSPFVSAFSSKTSQVFIDTSGVSGMQRALEWLQDTFTTDVFIPYVPYSAGVVFSNSKSNFHTYKIKAVGSFCLENENSLETDNLPLVGGRLKDILSRYDIIFHCFRD